MAAIWSAGEITLLNHIHQQQTIINDWIALKQQSSLEDWEHTFRGLESVVLPRLNSQSCGWMLIGYEV